MSGSEAPMHVGRSCAPPPTTDTDIFGLLQLEKTTLKQCFNKLMWPSFINSFYDFTHQYILVYLNPTL